MKAKRSEPKMTRQQFKQLSALVDQYGHDKVEQMHRLNVGRPTSSTKTADRMLYDRPVDGQAKKAIHPPRLLYHDVIIKWF